MEPEQVEGVVEKAYAAFVEAQQGRDAHGVPLPPYAALHDLHKGAWRQAVLTAVGAHATPPADEPSPVRASPAPAASKEDEEDKDGRGRGRRP